MNEPVGRLGSSLPRWSSLHCHQSNLLFLSFQNTRSINQNSIRKTNHVLSFGIPWWRNFHILLGRQCSGTPIVRCGRKNWVLLTEAKGAATWWWKWFSNRHNPPLVVFMLILSSIPPPALLLWHGPIHILYWLWVRWWWGDEEWVARQKNRNTCPRILKVLIHLRFAIIFWRADGFVLLLHSIPSIYPPDNINLIPSFCLVCLSRAVPLTQMRRNPDLIQSTKEMRPLIMHTHRHNSICRGWMVDLGNQSSYILSWIYRFDLSKALN